MDRPFINICGIQNYEDARAALDCGASSVGFLVNVESGAKNQINADIARDIVRKLSSGDTSILVTHFTSVLETVDLFKHIGAIALHIGNHIEPEKLNELSVLLPGIKILKSIQIGDEGAIASAKLYDGIAHMLTLDSCAEDCFGGTGNTHDWEISRKIAQGATSSKICLAGGLTPENVQGAIKLVRPHGISVNSGVEDKDGRKNPQLMKKFIENALSAFVG